MNRCLSLLIAILLIVLAVGCQPQQGPATSTPETTTTASTAGSTVDEPTGAPTDVTVPSDQETTAPPTSAATDPTATIGTTTAKPTTTATTTSKATTADWKKHYRAKQILRDPTFQNGFDVTGQEERAFIGTWYNTDSEKNTVWSIGQWGTYKSYTDRSGYLCMLRDRLETSRNILSNGMNTLTYNDARKSLTFTMNTYDFYGGQGHVNNESWPHLLIGQDIIDWETYFNLDDEEMLHYSPAADKVIVSLDVRMTSFSHEVLEGINACQFLSFYYVRSVRDTGFVWFGMPIFDDRGYNPDDTKVTFLMDGASNCYICGIPFAQVYNSTRPDGRYDFFNADFTAPEPGEAWMHIEMDLKPYLDMMAENALKGSKYNIFKQTSKLTDLYFTGMNIGYEIHGTYDVSFEIMNYAITTYVKK